MTCSASSSAKWEAEELPVLLQKYKYEVLTFKPFLYVARGSSDPKNYMLQYIFIRNKPMYLTFYFF